MKSQWVSVRSLLPWLPATPYLVSPECSAQIRQVLVEAGFSVLVADLSEVTDEAGLLAAVCAALPLPRDFASNWDALNDALGDLQAGDVGSVALLLLNSDVALRSDAHATIRSVHLLQSLSEQAETAVRSTGFQFEIFFVGKFQPT
jgi:hypothetical protein